MNVDDYIPHLERNRAALYDQRKIINPHSLLRSILTERQTEVLPDGTVLEPPKDGVPGRKVVILGDTSDPSAIIPLARDADILVHEATNAPISPAFVATNGSDFPRRTLITEEIMRARMVTKGHSTAAMAGEFAKRINARKLYMNHFSVA